MWVFELPEEDKMQALENFIKDTVYRHVKDFYLAQSIPINGAVTGPVYGPEKPPASKA